MRVQSIHGMAGAAVTVPAARTAWGGVSAVLQRCFTAGAEGTVNRERQGGERQVSMERRGGE